MPTESEMNETTASRVAATPFDGGPDADFILCSSDGVKFHVRRAFLSEVSPVLRGMLDIPQPAMELLPVMDMSEPSDVLDNLLRLGDPTICFELDSLEHVGPLFQAARKYQVEGAVAYLKQVLANWKHVERESPLRIYALACALGAQETARIAARHTLRTPIYDVSDYSDELRYMTGGAYHRLLQYRRDCSNAATSFAENASLFSAATSSFYGYFQRNIIPHNYHTPACPMSQYFLTLCPRYIEEYLKRTALALKYQPSGDVVTTPAMIGSVVLAASACDEGCKIVICDVISRFSEFYKQQIEDALSKVSTNPNQAFLTMSIE